MNDQSNALPAWMYRDPAKVAEQMQMQELGCKACSKAGVTMHGVVCLEPKNYLQKGVPHSGQRCKWFDERGNGNAS